MRHENVTIPVRASIDWKGIGYLFSIAGTLALGAVSCSAPDAPAWYFPTLAVGVAVTITGFVIRYLAHLKEKREIEKTEREAKQN